MRFVGGGVVKGNLISNANIQSSTRYFRSLLSLPFYILNSADNISNEPRFHMNPFSLAIVAVAL